MLVESAWARQLEEEAVGDSLYALAADIYPICRSITGDGVRETLGILGRDIGIKIHEVPTGRAGKRLWTLLGPTSTS
jgi:aminopeptidase-like protein